MTWESILKVGNLGPEEFMTLVNDIKALAAKQLEAMDAEDWPQVRTINSEIKNVAQFMERWNLELWQAHMEDDGNELV